MTFLPTTCISYIGLVLWILAIHSRLVTIKRLVHHAVYLIILVFSLVLFMQSLYVLVIAPLGGMLLVYRPETRGRVAPEGGGSINRQQTD